MRRIFPLIVGLTLTAAAPGAAALRGVALLPKEDGLLEPERRAPTQAQGRVQTLVDPDTHLAVLTAGDDAPARGSASCRQVAHPAPAGRTDTVWLREGVGEGPQRAASVTSLPDDAPILRGAFVRDAATFLTRPRTVELLALADAAVRAPNFSFSR